MSKSPFTPSRMSAELFAEFLEFQKFKAAAEAAKAAAPAPKSYKDAAEMPAAPPPPKPASVSSRPEFKSVPGFVRKVDYEKVMAAVARLRPNSRRSPHCKLWHVFSNLMVSNPELFQLTGEAHPGEDGRTYFSFCYRQRYASVNFHAYGQINGQKFIVETIDILMGKYETYPDAVCFIRDEEDAASEE